MRVPNACQRDLRPGRVDYLVKNFDEQMFGYPVVNWRDGVYWIIDGQHRLVCARHVYGIEDQDRKQTIECVVYENLTDQEMAEMFDRMNDRLSVHPFDKFKVRCTAERQRETSILRTVESQGLKVSQQRVKGAVGAVNALGRVYDRAGDVVLGQALRTIRDAYDSDHAAFDRALIEGIGLVFNRYNGRTDEKRLAEALSGVKNGVRGLIQRAEAQRVRTGNTKVQCLAAAVVEVYNQRRKGRERLQSWWKSSDAELEA